MSAHRPMHEAAGPALREPPQRVHEGERLRRWRLVLGGGDDDRSDGTAVRLTGDDAGIDAALSALYDAPPAGASRFGGRSRTGGLGASAPGVARWLGDIRRYFPAGVVQVMQRDAIERLDLQRLLLEPEMLAAVEPDVHLLTTLLSLAHLLPDTTRATARRVVAQVVDQLHARLGRPVTAAVSGAVARTSRTNRPRPADIDWHRTIRRNLVNYQPALGTIIPEHLVGALRRSSAVQREVIIAVDQSASMADSVVYASVLGAALASVRSLRTRLIGFDTSVVDLTDQLHDPVEVLFGVQLGGGTHLDQAVAYCESLVTRPAETVLVVISDLFEGAPQGPDDPGFVGRLARLRRSGVTCLCLLALSDEGAPVFDRRAAAELAALGIPAFACTPDAFADTLAAAIEGREITGGGTGRTPSPMTG